VGQGLLLYRCAENSFDDLTIIKTQTLMRISKLFKVFKSLTAYLEVLTSASAMLLHCQN
jgi:hypothetical protein